MIPTFRLSIRLLDGAFHGRGDGGEPEWPPSPLRAFQALVNAAARRHGAHFEKGAGPALRWLEGLGPPTVIAPPGRTATRPYRLYVPNNAGDLMVSAWARGDRNADMSGHRTEKDVRPTRFTGPDRRPLETNPDFLPIHYEWSLTPGQYQEGRTHEKSLKVAARSITHFGWGVDMAAGDAVFDVEEANILSGDQWRVVPTGGTLLRVPKAGTLADLTWKHNEFLNRLADGFRPVPPLSCFEVLRYHSPTVDESPTPVRPFAAFEIHRTIEDQEENAGKSKFRPFHHVRRVATVAGMVRHSATTVARQLGWSMEEVQRRILGHGDEKDGQSVSDDRLQFLPLPSITPVGVGGIRRVLVVAPLVASPPGFDLASLRRQLNGQELIDRDTCQAVAMLSGIPNTDKSLRPFVGPAKAWSTVTPVVLPGHDDPDGLRRKLREREQSGLATADEQKHLLERLDARVLALIWKAFHQAGWTPDALAGAEIEYRKVGWYRGLDLAKNYDLPPLKYSRYHVRVRFARPVRGPLAVGAGRYRGMGVFAAESG